MVCQSVAGYGFNASKRRSRSPCTSPTTRTGRSSGAILLTRDAIGVGGRPGEGWVEFRSAHRGVAQFGQSIGLQNRGSEVRILTPLPPSLVGIRNTRVSICAASLPE